MAMGLGLHNLGTKFRLALLATALLSILAFTLASLPILRGSIREDRMKLFVEQSTRALAENISHALVQYQTRLRDTANGLALLPSPGPPGAPHRDELSLLNKAAGEPVPGILPHGLFDLLAVVRRDGLILYANTRGRFGELLDTSALVGRHIGEFPEEEQAFLAATSGTGKRDWYRSRMVARVRPVSPGEDISRQYAIALAEPIPNRGRVLVGVISWEAVQKILDAVEAPLANVGFPSAYAFMFARDGDTIIAHKYRDPAKVNNYGTRLVQHHNLPELSRAVQASQLSCRYEYPPGSRKVSGLARIDDSDFGWTVGLGINDADVIAPIHALTRRLAVIGAAVLLLSLLLSHFLSQRITLDLRELTTSALRIAEGYFVGRLKVRSRDEVGQLAGAFNQMSAALAARDQVISQQQQRLFERMRLDQEVRIASEVQLRLFAQFRPPLVSLDYAGFCRPASDVSGDYYDFLALPPGKLGLLVADVAGKGLSAALLMASLHACVRTHAPLLGERCGEVVANVNALLYEATTAERYATLFYAVYDEVARSLTYINAGHQPALLLRAGALAAAAASVTSAEIGASSAPERRLGLAQPQPSCVLLDFGTPPVGIFQTIPAVQQTIQLAPGDWLVIFSDGIPEATNPGGEEFGRDQLADLVLQNHQLPAQQLGEAILAAVALHAADQPQADDRTLIVAHVL